MNELNDAGMSEDAGYWRFNNVVSGEDYYFGAAILYVYSLDGEHCERNAHRRNRDGVDVMLTKLDDGRFHIIPTDCDDDKRFEQVSSYEDEQEAIICFMLMTTAIE